MAKVYVTEFTGTYADHGRGGSAAYGVPVTENASSPLTTSGSSQQFAAFNTNTTLVRVHTDGIISFIFGANPTVATTNARMAANQTEYFAVSGGQKLAVITNT